MPAVTPSTGKFGSASAAVFLVDGYNMLAAKLQSLRYKIEALLEPTHGVGDSWEEHTPTGVSKVEVSQDGAFFDTTAGSSHAALAASVPSTPQSAQRTVCMGVAGSGAGQPFVGFQGAYSQSYEVLGQVGNLTRANATYLVSGAREDGVIVRALAAATADGNSEAASVDNTTAAQTTIPITSNSQANPTVVTTPVPHGLTSGDTALIAGVAASSPTINGERTVTVITTTTFSVPVDTSAGSAGTGGTFTRGKTNAGAKAYLQVTALTLGGHDGALVTVRHSDDDSTYADLVAFTVRTTTGAERVTVAGAVRRYLAQSLDLTGSGSSPSITYFVGVARG